MNIHNVISYVHNFDLSDKFQVVFEAHGSSYLIGKATKSISYLTQMDWPQVYVQQQIKLLCVQSVSSM